MSDSLMTTRPFWLLQCLTVDVNQSLFLFLSQNTPGFCFKLIKWRKYELLFSHCVLGECRPVVLLVTQTESTAHYMRG